MRHRMSGKQLSRNSSHRLALRRNLAMSLLEHEAIRTTEVKAKELRPFVERLITTAKAGTLHARRRVVAALGHDRLAFDKKGEILEVTVIQKLFHEIAPRYADRPGGYTRIIHLAKRRLGDAGPTVLLQLVEESAGGRSSERTESRRGRRAAKRHQAASSAAPAPEAAEAQEAAEPQADQAPQPPAGSEDQAKES